jgi:hypothetical protein
MEIKKILDFKNIPVYSDPYMEENTFIKGENNGKIFIITTSKMSNLLYKSFLHNLRKEKLEKIKN